jgi:SNF2 family DNA or RNA helicase
MEDEASLCPLVTPYTNKKGISPSTLERLYLLRKWDLERDEAGVIHNPIPFKWPPLLRTKIYDVVKQCETDAPLILREYQKVQIHHLTRMPKYINGDAVGLGKTLTVIASICWLKERFPDTKVVIVTTKSTMLQWMDEFLRFSYLRPFVMKDKYRGETSSAARCAQMRDFLNGTKKDILIVKYDSLKGTRKKTEAKFDTEGRPIKGGVEKTTEEMRFYSNLFKEHKEHLILVFDECQKFKGVGTANRNLVFSISRSVGKVWGLTATVMKNCLNEFYAIATAIGICPFGFMPQFVEEFCIMRPQYIGAGRKKMVLVGYKNIPEFKRGIRPFFLGRSQKQVKEPLPQLSTIYHPLDLNDQQIDLLDDIQNGLFVLPPSLVKVQGQMYERERDPDNMMTQLSVQQLVANHPGLLDPANLKDFYSSKLSPKEEALLDMLDGDLMGEKVIVFTKYKMWIDRLEKLTKDGNFTKRKFLRITGNENEKERNDNKRLFQSSDDHDLIVINSAGIEGINLQQAAHMVLLDLPWSWGDLIQLVGRMVRMASPHSACTLHILIAKGTLDEFIVETLKGKKGVFEQILGESHSAGILDNNTSLDLDSGMEGGSDDEYASLLKAHVKSLGMKTFLDGDLIEAARDNENYEMVFQKGKKKVTNKKRTPSLKTDKGKWGNIEEL